MILKVFTARGELVHDCIDAGCEVSWDGYVIGDGYVGSMPAAAGSGTMVETPLAAGTRVHGATDPGPEWDISTPGEAHLRPPAAA